MRKEIPILFSTPMVQAILAGRKTQTRRVIKSRHESGLFQVSRRKSDGQIISIESLDWDERNCEKNITCPYGQPGDLLWVRESWQMTGWDFEDGIMTVHYKDGQWLDCMAPEEDGDLWLLNYVERLEKIGCLKQDPNDEERFVFTDKPQPWKPSIHMPKAAARIWLEVTNVRAERLQDISEEDAIKEGIERHVPVPGDGPAYYKNYQKKDGSTFYSAVMSFESLWSSINGQESWQANPWVWVVEFKLLSTTGKP